ncbi:phosphatase domain-containing protein [Vibrio diabolicus]|uniref:phosphatase domain-containing protein n=1 Tax=Vibrio diabolicus TaxID=50719 RepID=UPI003750AF08
MNNKKTVLVDLDGTLALNKHRSHFISKSNRNKPDWISYFNACDKDQPNVPVIESVNALKQQGHYIHIFSARGDIVRDKTIKWLSLHGVMYDKLTMREMDTYTPDEILKRFWLLDFYPNYKEDILCVFDDRDKVVKMWRELGLVCFQVAEGNF